MKNILAAKINVWMKIVKFLYSYTKNKHCCFDCINKRRKNRIRKWKKRKNEIRIWNKLKVIQEERMKKWIKQGEI